MQNQNILVVFFIFVAMNEIFSGCLRVKYFPGVSLIVSRDTDITAAYQVTFSGPITAQREKELANERPELVSGELILVTLSSWNSDTEHSSLPTKQHFVRAVYSAVDQ